MVPTVGGIIFFGRHQWVAVGCLALILLEILAIMIGEAQRCPLCDASLVIREDRMEEFAHACPECGFLID